jgi:pimeloyl-ACP methyl ester carboxylesterase
VERIATNGIELEVVREGEGAPVVLLHGFPELWFSWRHQIPALTAAGYTAIAPNLRGYGGSSAPEDPAEYDQLTLAADVVGLLDALGHERAVVVGHDWGSTLAWSCALAHPDRFRAVAGLSVPFLPRFPMRPTDMFPKDHYLNWFQEPGEADAALAADVRHTFTSTAPFTREWLSRPRDYTPPPFMTEEELDVYVSTFERTGFTGGLNWYRAMDRSWELSEPYADRKVEQPALFLTGARDPAKEFAPASFMDGWVTDLRASIEVEGAGHWVNQERPDEVNRALLEFIRGL